MLVPRPDPSPRTPARDPAEVLAAQAERVRAKWRDPGLRRAALDRLDRRPDDPTTDAWRAILAGAHSFVAWLEGDEPWSALPAALPDGSSPRQLVSSHPFIGAPWLNQAT